MKNCFSSVSWLMRISLKHKALNYSLTTHGGQGRVLAGGNDVLGNPRPPAALANHTKFTNITLAQEAQETVAAVRKIISQASVLPRGWDEAYTEDGLK